MEMSVWWWFDTRFNDFVSAIVVEHQNLTNGSDSDDEVHLEEAGDKVVVYFYIYKSSRCGVVCSI